MDERGGAPFCCGGIYEKPLTDAQSRENEFREIVQKLDSVSRARSRMRKKGGG